METKRECGNCTLCCKMLGVAELKKEQNKWCVHCKIHKGCMIYSERPESCRDFNCLWLMGILPENLYPKDVGVVFGATTDGKRIVVYADPYAPFSYRRGIVAETITKISEGGTDVIIVAGNEREVVTSNPDTLKMLESITNENLDQDLAVNNKRFKVS